MNKYIKNLFGIERQFNHLINKIDNFNVFFIGGMGGTGKTSFLSSIADYLKDKKIYKNFIWVNCTEKDTVDNIIKKICQHINSSVLSYDEMLHFLSSEKYVLFIDDFHKIKGNEKNDFIKSSIKILKKGKMFIGSREKFKLDPIEQLEVLECILKNLSEKISKNLIRFILENHSFFDLDNSFYRKIFDNTKGNPYLIKLFLGNIIRFNYSMDYIKENKIIEKALSVNVFNNVFEDLDGDLIRFIKKIALFSSHVNVRYFHDYKKENFYEYISILKDFFIIFTDLNGNIYLHDFIREEIMKKISEEEKIDIIKENVCMLEGLELDLNGKEDLFNFYVELNEKEKAIDIIVDGNKYFNFHSFFYIRMIDKAIEWNIDYFRNILYKIKINILLSDRDFKIAISYIDKLELEADKDYYLAKYYSLTREIEKSDKYFKKIINKTEDKSIKYFYYLYLFNNSLVDGRYDESKKYVDIMINMVKDKEFIKEEDDYTFELQNYVPLLSFYKNTYQMKKIYDVTEGILEKYEGNDPKYYSKIYIYWDLIIFYTEIKNFKAAEKLYINLKKLNKYVKIHDFMRWRLSYVALVSIKKNRLDRAEKVLNYFLERVNGSSHFIVEIYMLLAVINIKLYKLDKVSLFIEKGLFYEEMNRSYRLEFKLYIQKIKLYILENDIHKAIKTLEILRDKTTVMMKDIYNTYDLFFKSIIERKRGNAFASNDYNDKYLISLKKLDVFHVKVLKEEFSDFERIVEIKKENSSLFVYKHNKYSAVKDGEYNDICEKHKGEELFIDLINYSVWINGKQSNIKKKKKLCVLLQFFIENKDKVLSVEEIFHKIWSRDYTSYSDKNLLTVTIYKLNKLIGKRIMFSDRDNGYFLNDSENMVAIFKSSEFID